MKIKILYQELKEKEFRSEKTLRNFLNSISPDNVLRAVRYENGILYSLELNRILRDRGEKLTCKTIL